MQILVANLCYFPYSMAYLCLFVCAILSGTPIYSLFFKLGHITQKLALRPSENGTLKIGEAVVELQSLQLQTANQISVTCKKVGS